MAEQFEYLGQSLKFKVTGREAMRQTVDYAWGRLRDFRQPFAEVKKHFLDRSTGTIFENFRMQGGMFSRGWKPLSPATRTEKERLAKLGAIPGANVDKILMRTGILKEGFRGRVIKTRGGKQQLVIDNPVPYFKTHHSMRDSTRQITTLGKKKMTLPRRVMMKISDNDEEEIKIILMRHITSVTRKKPQSEWTSL